MKNQIAAFLSTALVASLSFAQNTSTTTMPKQDASSSKGFRISVVKPMLEAELKVKSGGKTYTSKDAVDETLGFALGYASLPVQSLGWTANFAYLELKEEGDPIGMLRLDGNAAYAFSNLVNVKGGLNLSKFTDERSNEVKPAIGLQASVGFQVTKNFGLDLGYTQMHQTAAEDGLEMEVKISGFEIGLNGTF